MADVPIGGHRRGSRTAVALVDDADLNLVNAYRWSLTTKRNGFAALARARQPDGTYRFIYMHRLVAGLVHGDDLVVDHINGDGLDNRRANLRVCTAAENAQNRPHGIHQRSGKRGSRFRGVVHNPKYSLPWQVTLRFPTEEEAANTVEAWRRQYMPFATPDPNL